MENWHLFAAAFILSLVDLSVLGAFLWYQFSTLYFAWHLCPMIVNRICELIAFICTGGMLPSLFAIVQVPLSLFSTTIYANRRQHFQNKLLLAVYCTLLVYEEHQPYIAFHMFALFTHPMGSSCPHSSQLDGFVTVQQPDGKKVMLGKVLQPAVEVPAQMEASRSGSGVKDNVSITIPPLSQICGTEQASPFSEPRCMSSLVGQGVVLSEEPSSQAPALPL